MIDNPISWGILVILAFFFVVWFAYKCEQEISQNRKENDDYFWEIEHNYREK